MAIEKLRVIAVRGESTDCRQSIQPLGVGERESESGNSESLTEKRPNKRPTDTFGSVQHFLSPLSISKLRVSSRVCHVARAPPHAALRDHLSVPLTIDQKRKKKHF